MSFEKQMSANKLHRFIIWSGININEKVANDNTPIDIEYILDSDISIK